LIVKSGSVAYLKFDLSSVTGTVTEAKLNLYLSNTPNGGYANFLISGVGDDTWTESMTYSTRPAFGGQEAIQIAAASGWVTTDVTNFIKSQSTGDKMASLLISYSNYGGTLSFNSREHSSNKPVLEVTTNGPSNKTPYINKALAGNEQVLIGWTKVSGTSYYRVYRSTSPTSGFVLLKDNIKSLQYWDHESNHPGMPLTNGTTYYYKVGRVDSSGVETLSAVSPGTKPSYTAN